MNSGAPRDDFERELFPQLSFFRNMARKLTKNATAAEDLYGDTLLKMVQHKDSYQLGTTIRGWGCFIMRNLLYSQYRRAWRWQEWNDVFDTTLPSSDNPHAQLEFKEVLESLKYIPAEQAEAFMMIAEGMTYEEAAAEAGVEVGTIKSRACRGRALLEKLHAG